MISSSEVRVTLASGKGGAGKTFVSLHLAALLTELYGAGTVSLVDTDVEEPNLSVYLKGELTESVRAKVLIPEVDNDRCTDPSFYSGICEFHALIPLKGGLLVYEHNCHSCSACWTLSPDGSVVPREQEIGTVRTRMSGGIRVIEGVLDEGSIATVAMIKETKTYAQEHYGDRRYTLIDAPPGTSCAALEAVADTDLTIVVAEDTPFGIHDAKILIRTLEILETPFVVVINKWRESDSLLDPYCEASGYSVLARIPFRKEIARLYGGGQLVHSSLKEIRESFQPLITWLREAVNA